MKQNKYDDTEFFEKYSQMARSIGGLSAAGEWPALRAMLPDLRNKRMLDLGCGYGWHCLYARDMGAQSVVGIDISEKMLERAREMTLDSAIEYRRLAIEELDYPANRFDVVLSSLAFHYIEDFQAACRQIHHCLTPGGHFVFSVEHPIFTSRAEQDWHYGPDGERMHWPVDHYQQEGLRRTAFLGSEDVVKYHRTTSAYLNGLLDAGFGIAKVAEPQPTEEMLRDDPAMRDETRRPMFLIVAAVKQEVR